MFDQKLKFELHLVKLNCDDDWVEETLLKACELLKALTCLLHQKLVTHAIILKIGGK